MSLNGPVIAVHPIFDASPPERYSIRFNIPHPILNRNNTTSVSPGVTIEVALPKKYPIVPPWCTIDCTRVPPPFHPYVTAPPAMRWLRRARWVDPDPHDPREGLAAFVLRIARALQFDLRVINLSRVHVVNEKALFWFQSELRGRPFDQTALPVVKKRFVMHPAAPQRMEITPAPERPSTAEPTVTPPQVAIPERTAAADATPPPPVRAERRFVVTQTSEPVSPIAAPLPTFYLIDDLRTEHRSDPRNETHHLYISGGAAVQMFRHIQWGRSTHANRVEQGGLLVGRPYRDPASGITYSIVEETVPGRLAKGTSAFLNMDHETWKDMLEQMDRSGDPDDRVIVGWYHTHPNELSVFMSGTDVGTQACFFNTDWQFAIVLNPQRRLWRAFYGAQAHECFGAFFYHAD